MEERTPCTFCENFQGSGFFAQGELHVFNFCPVCGRPYTQTGMEMQKQRTESDAAGDLQITDYIS